MADFNSVLEGCVVFGYWNDNCFWTARIELCYGRVRDKEREKKAKEKEILNESHGCLKELIENAVCM